MAFTVDENGDISLIQGDSGFLVVEGIETDKNSSAYMTLDKKVKTVEAQQKAMSDINQTTSWEDANTIIEQQKDNNP